MRIFRVFATTIFCITLLYTASSLYRHFNGIGSGQEVFLGVFFFLLIGLPSKLLEVSVLAVVLLVMDTKGLRGVWHYALVWGVSVAILLFISSAQMSKELLIYTIMAALIGIVYWALTGRTAGQPGYVYDHFVKLPFTAQIAIAVAAVCAAIALRWAYFEALKNIGPS